MRRGEVGVSTGGRHHDKYGGGDDPVTASPLPVGRGVEVSTEGNVVADAHTGRKASAML